MPEGVEGVLHPLLLLLHGAQELEQQPHALPPAGWRPGGDRQHRGTGAPSHHVYN